MSKHSEKAPLPLPESFNLPLTGVESHAHLDGKHFADDLEVVLERARKTGVARIGQIFMSSALWEENKSRFLPHDEFFFLLGIHPTEAELLTDEEYEKLRHILKTESRMKAVGEIGLDYYWKDCPRETQRTAFVRLLHLAGELDLPVAIHSRDATEDTIAILTAEGFKDHPLVWHCFGGDAALAERILELGWHISIPGPVTFPANQALRDALRQIPADRLMIETDCPYLAPMPYRGKRNEPAYLAFTIQAMAEARGEDPADLWTACGVTALKLFRLPQLAHCAI
ncbi:MAG: TatD family hydrolase [Deltaproteobacteria bacterium]|nr:TatD family hydrolase [Deltaproteobacteria bacterium]